MATNQADPFRLRNDPIWQPELERLNRVVSDLTGPPPSVAAVRQVRAMAEGPSGNLVERMLVLSRMIRPA
jgi:hypothetical protein